MPSVYINIRRDKVGHLIVNTFFSFKQNKKNLFLECLLNK